MFCLWFHEWWVGVIGGGGGLMILLFETSLSAAYKKNENNHSTYPFWNPGLATWISESVSPTSKSLSDWKIVKTTQPNIPYLSLVMSESCTLSIDNDQCLFTSWGIPVQTVPGLLWSGPPGHEGPREGLRLPARGPGTRPTCTTHCQSQ